VVANKITVVHLNDQWQNDHTATASHVLASVGIAVRDREYAEEPDALFMDKSIDLAKFDQQFAKWRGKPRVLLIYGGDIECGLADQFQQAYDAQQLEVLRLLLWKEENKAFIGGDPASAWVKKLRQHLAKQGVISLVCRRIEVDEIAWGLTRYLAWKQRFFFDLGKRCDQAGARLEVVSKGLGMDKRVGQGWFISNLLTADLYEQSKEWLLKQLLRVVEKTNITHVALWGCPPGYLSLLQDLLPNRQVKLYVPEFRQNPNVLGTGWIFCDNPVAPLAQADLLLILERNPTTLEIDLTHIVREMNQAIVIDACSMFPLQEMEAHSIKYRSYGQNTNVWEWN